MHRLCSTLSVNTRLCFHEIRKEGCIRLPCQKPGSEIPPLVHLRERSGRSDVLLEMTFFRSTEPPSVQLNKEL